MDHNKSNELYHWGIKGQKWGVRRYQNADGTLTEKGKKRYARDAREKEYNKYDELSGQYYKKSKKNGVQKLDPDANRYVTEDMRRTKNLTDSTGRMTRELENITNKSIRNARAKTPQMDLTNMSDKELRDRINRTMLERQYNDMFNPQNEKKGRERVLKTLEVAGSVIAVTGGALEIALHIRDLKGGKD